MTIRLTSKSFADGDMIPIRFTCNGEDVSPPLEWSGVPPNARSLALVMDDPDAPMGTWVHWVLYNIPPGTSSLAEGIPTGETTLVGTQGKNDSRRSGYSGPCPPRGMAHRYYFKLYALDSDLKLPPGLRKSDLEKAIQGHILAQGQLIGRYAR
jgi:hypothetical protein